jgi:hypothetical protein
MIAGVERGTPVPFIVRKATGFDKHPRRNVPLAREPWGQSTSGQ